MSSQQISHIFNRTLTNFKLKSPVVFTFHINWNTFEKLNIKQYKHIKNLFNMNNIENFEFLPILTDSRTDMPNRINQFKNGIERIADKYNSKCHVIGYSFAGVIPRGYISLYNGDDYISTVLSIGTPNKGSQFVNNLISNNYSFEMNEIEPVIRALGLHKNWLMEEYSSKTMHDNNSMFVDSENVKYLSVGGRKEKLNSSESIRYIHEMLSSNNVVEVGTDGIVLTKEAEYGEHLLNFDADHFELIEMRPNFNAKQLFEFYSNAVKSNDVSFMSLSKKEKIVM